MKATLIPILFLLVSCDSSEPAKLPPDLSTSSTLPKPFDQGTWSGSFQIITDDGKVVSTQTGVVSITFAENTYSYTGEVEASSAKPAYTLLEKGVYEFTTGGIVLNDQANMLGASRAPSLYLSGEFQHKVEGTSLAITQVIAGRSTTLALAKTLEAR